MFTEELQDLLQRNLLRSLITVESGPGPEVVVEGKTSLLFCSNNYLGLANDPRLVEAAHRAAQRYGWGAGASRLLSGNHQLHEDLELELALFTRLQSALLFGSGYQANTGVIPTLVGPEDLILSDELNHASLIDGSRLSHAQVRVYPHRNIERLERVLKEEGHSFGKRLIVTESVFSMEGTLAPISEIWALAQRYKALLYIDDAHGVGVLGARAAGAVEHFALPVKEENLIVMATLGKALGAFGAFVAGSRDLRSFLVNKARTFIFSTAFPPANAAAVLQVLKIMREEPRHLESLRQNCRMFSTGLVKLGVAVQPESQFMPIQPLLVGEETETLALANRLEEAGILARAIRPPTVPKDRCRIRFSLMASHKTHHIEKVLDVLKKIL